MDDNSKSNNFSSIGNLQTSLLHMMAENQQLKNTLRSIVNELKRIVESNDSM